ncbi:MAG: hypothetical protein WC522_07615 [Candidatus Omnitrophota bacterium]
MSDIKCSCGSKDVFAYELVKCKKCGKVIKDFSEGLKKGWKLKITYNEDKSGEIWIRGNKSGLEFLASCCLAIIGKNDPSGHIHLQWQMNNLLPGSTETLLEYSDYAENYQEK